jgi:hypothetical protein
MTGKLQQLKMIKKGVKVRKDSKGNILHIIGQET